MPEFPDASPAACRSAKTPRRSPDAAFCSYCYDGSTFKQPDFTLEQMQQLVEQKLREQGMPGFVAKWLAGSTKKLQRWS